MSSSSVRLEVVPVAGKLRYEKSLIGQLFTGDGKDSVAKAKSPLVVRAKTDPKPELKLNSNVEVRRPDTRARSPEPPTANPPAEEFQSGYGSSPTPPARAASSSPTPTSRSQSPPPSKSPDPPGLANLTSKKGGKRLKIDLKKGKNAADFSHYTSEFLSCPKAR